MCPVQGAEVGIQEDLSSNAFEYFWDSKMNGDETPQVQAKCNLSIYTESE